jgi:galactonate dehydratase
MKDSMKITDIKFYVVDADWRNWIFLKVFTDEGLTGVGETSQDRVEAKVVAALTAIRSYLVGKSPFDIEHHWRALFHGSFWRDLSLLSALGGIEMALWDIVGKACNQPVYNLLGGRCRNRVRCYTHISEATSGHSIEERAEEARQAVAQGWTALKWDPLPANFLTLRPSEMRHVVAQIQAVREAVGDDIDLLIEIHGRLNPTTAIQLAREIAPFQPFFMEEPVPPDNVDMLAKVAAHTPIPLATGERLLTVFDYWPLLERQLVDYIQPDVIHTGGLLACKKIAALAEARYVGVAPHNPNGPVCTAATLQLVANLPNFTIQEMPADDYQWAATWRDEFLVDPSPVRVTRGYLEVPTTPGLGIDLDEAALARYPVKSHPWSIPFQAENAIAD